MSESKNGINRITEAEECVSKLEHRLMEINAEQQNKDKIMKRTQTSDNIKHTTNKHWGGCREKGILLHSWWKCKLMQPLWRTVWRFLEKLNIEVPYDPEIPLLGIFPKKTITQQDTYTPMFTAALFILGHRSNLDVHRQRNG